jgi:hypothetical protein
VDTTPHHEQITNNTPQHLARSIAATTPLHQQYARSAAEVGDVRLAVVAVQVVEQHVASPGRHAHDVASAGCSSADKQEGDATDNVSEGERKR